MKRISRRSLLHGSAATAGAALLTACTSDEARQQSGADSESNEQLPTGSATTQPPKPNTFDEAPELAELVEAGRLPPVEERLPASPYVVPHNWLESGKYGGTLRLPTSDTDHAGNKEYMYGHSLLRWLNDCLDLGPGLAEGWETNDDASVWTFHLRAGLKWSDGEPCTTADILFWWEDMVGHEDFQANPPDELKSGTGTVASVNAPDERTLVLSFDAPAPLTPDRVANWVNGGNGTNGPTWIVPKHYLQQFHPRYSDQAPDDWAAAGGALDVKGNFARNPQCPTMTGWRLASYQEGESLEWERNPYYWCVDGEGRQLPYIDRIVMTANSDPEVGKLQMQEGRVDYAHGPFVGVELADVSAFKRAEERSGLRVLLWDSGAGGGATVMFNQDYHDKQLRTLFRDARFRRALSYAFDRAEVRKAIYFDTGEKTTGTLSPKAIEYHIEPEGPRIYRQWRDSYVDFDPDKANQLLDELGLRDQNGDGKRELPDGSELVLRLEYPADEQSSHVQTNELVAEDWTAVGIETSLNPVSPEAFSVQWSAGELMTNTTWELGDGPNHLVFPNFLVPVGPSRWAPLQGQYYAVRGTSDEDSETDTDPFARTPPRMAPEPDGPVEQLWELYDQTKTEPDEMRRHQLVWDMIKVHIDEGPFMHGSVANYPRVILAHHDLRNVPSKQHLAQGGFVNPWIHPTPAVYDPETYFWTEPDQHR